MILKLLRKLRAIFKPASVENGKPGLLDPVEILRVNSHDLLRLAEQIHAHAKTAPYPHVAERLRQIVLEKRESVKILREKLLSLKGELDYPRFNLKSGKNHWERISRDIEDQRVLESRLQEQASRLAEEAPEISDLLKRIMATETSHKEILMDLVMRADPQANQT